MDFTGNDNSSNRTDTKEVMTGRERVVAALNYSHVDRVPVDLGGTLGTGAHVSVIAKLRQALGLDKKGETVKVVDLYQMLGEVAERVKIFSAKGGFVFSTVHNIQCNTPTENVLAMFGTLGRKVQKKPRHKKRR
jgi:hypothetical protein